MVAVVTQPGKPGSRGRPAPRPVGELAAALKLPLLTPARIRDEDAVSAVVRFEPECLVVAAYGQILPAALLEAPRHGALNVHASLLPRWRGAAPVAHAILAGDAETGVSIIRMDVGLDTGPVYSQRRVPVRPDETTPSLTATLADIGAALLVEVLDAIARGEEVATPQPESGVTPAPRLRRQDGEVTWHAFTAVEIDRRVRALQPWPGVTAPLAGIRVRILEGGVDQGQGAPGDIVRTESEAVVVAAREGLYRVERVLPPGSRAMSGAAYLRGRRTSEGTH